MAAEGFQGAGPTEGRVWRQGPGGVGSGWHNAPEDPLAEGERLLRQREATQQTPQQTPPVGEPGSGGPTFVRRPSRTGSFLRNLSNQFDRPEVNQQIQHHSDNAAFAQHFRKAGLSAALHYTITGQVPEGLIRTSKRMEQRNQPGKNPGDVQAQRQPQPGTQPDPRDQWIRASQQARKNQRLKNAWGTPAPSEAQMEEDDWAEARSTQSRKENRAGYKRTVGTPTKRPVDLSDIEERHKTKPDTSDLRRATP